MDIDSLRGFFVLSFCMVGEVAQIAEPSSVLVCTFGNHSFPYTVCRWTEFDTGTVTRCCN